MTDRETVEDQPKPEPPPHADPAMDLHADPVPPDILDLPPSSDGPLIVGSSQPLAVGTLEDSPPVFGAGSSGVSGGRGRIGDRIFGVLTAGSGVFVIALVTLVGVFLLIQAIPAIAKDKSNFFGHDWTINPNDYHFGILGLLEATVFAAAIGMIIAVPIAIGIALFMTQYAPKRLVTPIAYVIDLLAAIPSIVYGIWGFTILSPKLEPVQRFLYHFGAFPIFKDKGFITGTIFDGGVVLAVMILPIVTAISRDVFARTPRHNVEAAWALGATRWEVIRLAVLPYGRPGVVSGAMLGLGRALGETIAISLILSAPAPGAKLNVSIFSGGETFASKIANGAAEFGNDPGPYIAAGLVLFLLTFAVNAGARAIVNRRREFTE